MPLLDVLPIVVILISGLALFFASLPFPGSLTIINNTRTEEQSGESERGRRVARWMGLALMLAGMTPQAFVTLWPDRVVDILGVAGHWQRLFE